MGRTPDKGASGDLPSHTPNSNEVPSMVSETQFARHPMGWQPWPLGNLCPDMEQLRSNYMVDGLILSALADHVAGPKEWDRPLTLPGRTGRRPPGEATLST